MGKMSRDKGKRGEREIANILKEHGFKNARRTSQYCGTTGDASDVIGLDGFHIEVKYVEKLNIDKALEQAIRDSEAKPEKKEIPVVMHRANRHPWKVTMRIEDFLAMVQPINS